MHEKIYKYFTLILCLSKRDILVKLHDMKLGLVWIILPAILPIVAYSVLAILGIKENNTGMPFVIYVATGYTIYMYISSFIKATINSLNDKVLLKTYDLPIIVVVLIKNQITFIELGVRCIILIGLYFYFHIEVSFISILLIPIYLSIITMFSFSIGVFSGLLNLIYKDIGQLFTLFLRYGLFLSSVIFPFPKEGWIGIIGDFNILNTFVDNIRNSLVYGVSTLNNEVSMITIFITLILYFLTNAFLTRQEYKIKELL